MSILYKYIDDIKVFILALNPTYVSIAVIVMMVITTGIFAGIAYELLVTGALQQKAEQMQQSGYKQIVKGMNNSKSKAFNYTAIQSKIKCTGLYYMSHDKLTPVGYLGLCCMFAMLGFLIGIQENLLVGLILMPVGYKSLDLIAKLSNDGDNENMLEDIKNIYDTLRIQTKAGVYITSVLTDCYLVVQNKRLKKALLKLTSDITAKNDINEALDGFQASFVNPYINTLVIIIKQSMQTGQASKMFEDIRDQITDIEEALTLKEKRDIKRKTTIVQVLVYGAIIGIAIFVCMTSLKDAF